ncbi:MAG: DsbA family protein [Motiliproteus sp.]
MRATLYYAHDPMCSWCWGFSRTWQSIERGLPPSVTVERLLGGLAADSDVAMPAEMQQFLRQTWQRIQQQIPGTEFNFDFWDHCSPRRSTYPACRAVIAAANQGAEYHAKMTLAIQKGYYLEARNPSDDATLIGMAKALGLDVEGFTAELNAPQTQQRLMQDILRSQQLGAQGFPSLILQQGDQQWLLPLDYHNPDATLQRINSLLGHSD